MKARKSERKSKKNHKYFLIFYYGALKTDIEMLGGR